MARIESLARQFAGNTRLQASDAALLQATISGDHSALAVVWTRYQRLVQNVVYRALGPDSEAEDVTQEVFLALLRGAKNIRNAGALSGYLRGSALRIAAQELRRRRRARNWEQLSASGVLPDAPIAPRDLADSQAVAALLRLFSGLKPRPRNAFVLRCVHHMGWQDVATELGISESTAKRDVAMVRALLNRALPHEPALHDYAQRGSLLRRISTPFSAIPNTSASVS